MEARPVKVLIEPGPDGARGLGGNAQTYGWVLVDDAGEWIAFSCIWFETAEMAARNARSVLRPDIEVTG